MPRDLRIRIYRKVDKGYESPGKRSAPGEKGSAGSAPGCGLRPYSPGLRQGSAFCSCPGSVGADRADNLAVQVLAGSVISALRAGRVGDDGVEGVGG